MNKDRFRTMNAGCLIEPRLPLLGESLDAFEGNSVISTYAPILRPQMPWRSQIFENWLIVAVAYWDTFGLRCVLSREGQVNIYGPGGHPDHTYQIPGAGVFSEAARGLGYVNRIRAVGEYLLVCGQSRQVYGFRWDGKDLASGRWSDIAGPMRQPPMPEPPDGADDEALERWLDENDAVDFVDIGGPAIDDLYAVGDETWHWDGKQWRPLELPTDEPLAALKVLDAGHILCAGHNGTLLLGNARDGFQDLSGVNDHQNFTSVEWFEDRPVLASNLGLFGYDRQTRRIEPLRTGLQPDLQDCHLLDVKDGVLWSFGFKDLAYCDANGWARVDHPDNPPIR